MFTYWRDIFSCLLIEFTRNSVFFIIKITLKPPDVYDNQLNRCAIFWLTLQKSKTCRNHMIFVIIMFDFMKKTQTCQQKKKKRKLWWLLFLVTKFSVLLSSNYLLVYRQSESLFCFSLMKNLHTKKLNKSNFRIFFMETQIYLCHKFEVSRWKMSLKTIHNT